MRIAIVFVFIVVGLVTGFNGLFSTTSTSIHQIIQNLYLTQSLLAFIAAGVIYGKGE